MTLALYFVFGAIIGSFLTVCISRVPARESLISPARSYCPECERTLTWYENIPIISWLALRGRCKSCKQPISIQYPLCEVLTASLSVLTFETFGVTPTGVVLFAFLASLVVLAFIDFDHFILPNRITLPWHAIAAGVVIINHFYHVFEPPISQTMTTAVWGYLAGAGFFFAVAKFFLLIARREGLGLGDVKLLGFVGILLGPEAALFTIFGGSLLGCLGTLLRGVIFRVSIRDHFPFGPYLCIATALYVFGINGETLILFLIAR